MPGHVRFSAVPSTIYPPSPYVARHHHELPKESSQKSSPSVPANGLHPLLSAVPYNVRLPPREGIHTIYDTVGMHPMRHDAPKRIRLVSKAFPWPIEIRGSQPVTCADVWEELYSQLHQTITDDDWAHINHDSFVRRAFTKAYEKRVKPEDRSIEPHRRIDYLGNSTFFIGLEKDDAYVKKRLIPGAKNDQETWVARFAK